MRTISAAPIITRFRNPMTATQLVISRICIDERDFWCDGWGWWISVFPYSRLLSSVVFLTKTAIDRFFKRDQYGSVSDELMRDNYKLTQMFKTRQHQTCQSRWWAAIVFFLFLLSFRKLRWLCWESRLAVSLLVNLLSPCWQSSW